MRLLTLDRQNENDFYCIRNWNSKGESTIENFGKVDVVVGGNPLPNVQAVKDTNGKVIYTVCSINKIIVK